jgi:hypothetical protein
METDVVPPDASLRQQAGGEARASKKFGPYIVWPADLPL